MVNPTRKIKGQRPPKWTIVQHSAMGYKNNPTFYRGLETRRACTSEELSKVIDAGGVLFERWLDADNYAYREMYPDRNSDLVPRARGTFATVKIDGLRVYIPRKEQDSNVCDA